MAIADAAAFSATMTGQLGLSELRTGDVLAGRFRIETMLGLGGMGVVYRAFDQSLDLDVAIKLLRPELARKPEAFERFRQELLLARQVSSPHVVRIHDIAQHEGRWFISMDFIDGESLEKRMDRVGKLPLDEALAITRDLLDGLRAAEQRGVVHRDLKPANILLDTKGSAYITDFGVARSLGATGATGSGVIVGTPEYLSPEQARGEIVDTRSDLYAVGLMVYEMLVGALPFNSGTPAETVMQRIVRPPPSLAKVRPDLPGWLHLFVDRLLKLNPAHRFATAKDTLHALETRRVPRQPIDRRILLVVALLIVAAIGTLEWVRRHPDIPPKAALAAPATLRAALMPISAPANDGELQVAARAFEEHLRTWLRNDKDVSVIPRQRILQAIARTAPAATPETLQRLAPEVAQAASANRMLRGELSRTPQGLTIRFAAAQLGSQVPEQILALRGSDLAALYTAYAQQLPAFLRASGFHAAAPPGLAAGALGTYGQALLDLDAQKPDAASAILAKLSAPDADTVLVAAARLRAEETASQDAPAQNDRDAVIKRFAQDATAEGLELYAQALSDNDENDRAVTVWARAVREFPHDPALLLANADALRAHGEGAKALDALKQYVTTNADDAHAWFLLGRTAIEQSQARDAVENYLLHAQTLNTLARDGMGEAETRNALGIGYERLGELDAAADEYTRAVTLREKLGDTAGLAKSLRNLAIVQAELGRHSDAERTLARAKVVLDKLGDRASLALLYNDRGVVAEDGGDFAEALSFYRQAYAVRQQLGDAAAIAESLNNIGYASYRMGDYDNATAYWTQALAQYTKLDDRTGILHIQQNTALLQVSRGQFANARKSLTDSRDYAQQHQLPEEAAVADVSLTELSLLEGRYATAQDSAEQASKVFARRGDERGLAECAVLRARVAIALGQTERAAELLTAIDRKRLNEEQTGEFLLASAQNAAQRNERKLQVTQLDAAAEAAAKAHGGELSMRVDFERVRMALATRDYARSAKLLADVRKQNTRLNDTPLRLQWLELETALALRTGNPTAASAHYRETLPLLKTVGRYAGASTLHALGESAFAGRASDAAAARQAGVAAQAQVLADAPENARAALASELARRLDEESGDRHGK